MSIERVAPPRDRVRDRERERGREHACALTTLRRTAEELAEGRGQKPTTTHLLAAIASGDDRAAQLLLDRRLDLDTVLRAARVTVDDSRDAITKALDRAKDLASRSSASASAHALPIRAARAANGRERTEANSIHLLVALCQDMGTAAHRTLVQCGTDLTRLRTAALHVAMGLTPPRRVAASASASASSSGSGAGSAPARASQASGNITGLSGAGSNSPKPHDRSARPAHITPAPAVPSSTLPASRATPAPPRKHANTPAMRSAPASATPPVTPQTARPSPTSSTSTSGSTSTSKSKRRDPKTAGASADRFALDPKQFPSLCALGQNLTQLASRGELDPVVGREIEMERTLDVLAKRQASNACLIGAPGVGKTSVVRGLAQRIAAGRDIASFEDKIIVSIDPSALVAGTAVRGSLAERIHQLKAELARSKGRVLIFFDQIHTLFGSDAGDEAAGELRSALSRGELACIGATTEADYRKTIDSDPALSRCFTSVDVCELSADDALVAVERIAPLFEKHHDCSYNAMAIEKSVTWSVRYLPGKALPDKAVQVLDLAAARVRRRASHAASQAARDSLVRAEHVAEVVSELAGVPVERLLESDADRLLRLEELLSRRIVGHGHALERIAHVLRRNASGFRSRRPIGTFLLLGPTGVGKTETAKAIAECLFHSADAMTRLDLSEYAEPHAIARLVGAPPGYVGFEAGGQLTEAVRRRPYQVILLDEIEKAHRDVLESFLGVFDEGRLTDGRGRTVDFTNTVILLTSNLGADIATPVPSRHRIGFTGSPGSTHSSETQPNGTDASTTPYQRAVTEAARRALPPELFNRLDEVIAFSPLSRADVAEVARRILRSLGDELKHARAITLRTSEAAIEALLDLGGFDPELGARPMRRAIGRHIEAPIAEMVLKGELRAGDSASVDVDHGKLAITASRPHAARPLHA